LTAIRPGNGCSGERKHRTGKVPLPSPSSDTCLSGHPAGYAEIAGACRRRMDRPQPDG
jgi:hypothetical protein